MVGARARLAHAAEGEGRDGSVHVGVVEGGTAGRYVADDWMGWGEMLVPCICKGGMGLVRHEELK